MADAISIKNVLEDGVRKFIITCGKVGNHLGQDMLGTYEIVCGKNLEFKEKTTSMSLGSANKQKTCKKGIPYVSINSVVLDIETDVDFKNKNCSTKDIRLIVCGRYKELHVLEFTSISGDFEDVQVSNAIDKELYVMFEYIQDLITNKQVEFLGR